MVYYFLNSVIYLSLLIIGGLAFGARSIFWTIIITLIYIMVTQILYHQQPEHRLNNNFFPAAIFAVILLSISFLFAINSVYKREVRAESLLEDDGVTRVTLSIRPAPDQSSDFKSSPPLPTPPASPPTNPVNQLISWFQAFLKQL